jgi:hypothetical protein
MPVLLEGNVTFTTEEESFISFIAGDSFPWFLTMATKHFPALSHTFYKRTDTPETGELWSNHTPAAELIFRRICRDNNINLRKIYRMAVNLTFADPSLHGDPHNDHESFPHKVMLIYLNKFDAGQTWLFDADGNVECTIEPSIDKFVVFEGGMHANGFCKPQQKRIVFVATFDGDILPAERLEAAE